LYLLHPCPIICFFSLSADRWSSSSSELAILKKN
jgi:hypothetical protein